MSTYSIKALLLLGLVTVSACSTQVKQATDSTIENTGKAAAGDASTFSVTTEQKQQYRQAITALNNNDLDEAEKLLKDFQQQKPGLAGPLANLGLVFYKRGNTEQAEKYLDQAIQLNDKQAQALNLKGEIAYRRGQVTQAEDYYKKALDAKDDYANAHYNIALLYDVYLQDIAKAVVHYRRYLELSDKPDQNTKDWLEQLENSLKETAP